MTSLDTQVPPLNTTLMGMLRGVANHFRLPWTDPFLYGATGHAFLINLHPQLSPSSPNCWDRRRFFELVQNLGIEVRDLGLFGSNSTPEERERIGETVRREVDAGRPVGLLNTEFQLIIGYDGDTFHMTQPWPGMDFPPGRLNAKTWEEFDSDAHASFFGFAPCQPAETMAAVKAGLQFSLDTWDHPRAYACDGYAMGPEAYRFWAEAIDEYGQTHGHWWNATVWSECRTMAARFFEELSHKISSHEWESLARDYNGIAREFARVADREAPTDAKREHVRRLARYEHAAIERIRTILATMQARSSWLL